jgi:hypothetical protein
MSKFMIVKLAVMSAAAAGLAACSSAAPAASPPTASQPVASQPVASQPVASQPVASQPVASQPVATTASQPTGATSGQSCSLVDTADGVAATVTGGNLWCQWAMSGQFAMTTINGSQYGTWAQGGVPSGSTRLCSGTLESGATDDGEKLTVYVLSGATSEYGSPGASLCDSFFGTNW